MKLYKRKTLYLDFLINTFLVKSTNDIHHKTNSLANETIDCDKLSMDFKNKDMGFIWLPSLVTDIQ